ncbi:unnamed protein product [Larinioides sclopetarius]|uniref:Acyltransferase 3 domain-containing protein n=1 Tax=Larinioides sclopetarius TaxID=280406 RepID=A0AAV2AAW8_9ARAC
MENSTHPDCYGFPWQTSRPCMFLGFRTKLLAAIQTPGIIPQRAPMKLTQEAVYMIYVILVFVGLAVIGSSITAYEFFFKNKEKKSKSCKNGYDKSITTGTIGILKERTPSERHDSLQDCKSFFKCFCVVRNARKILSTSATKGQIDCLQGLRFIINVFIIGFHFLPLYIGIVRHLADLKPLLGLKVAQLALNSMFTVDVFLVISGFLNANAFFKRYNRSCGKISWFNFFFKRFVRLTPVYMIILGFYTTLFTYMGNGPLWPSYSTNPICRGNWWWHLLYFNNFESSYRQCLECCWSLAADMQLYIISPLFMVPLMRWPRFGCALILACISGSCIISFVLSYHYSLLDGLSRMETHVDDLNAFIIKFWKYFEVLHIKPYTRIGSYLVGILLVYYLHKKTSNQSSTKNNSMTLLCGWIATAIFMWICFFPLYLREDTIMLTALYNSTKNLIFSCGLAWIIYVSVTGQSEFLNKFLSWKFFFPLSRLSYCAFLIHPLIIVRLSLQSQDFVDFGYISMISLYLYICVSTYFIAFFVSMFFEMPVLNLLDWFSKKEVKRNSNLTHLD